MSVTSRAGTPAQQPESVVVLTKRNGPERLLIMEIHEAVWAFHTICRIARDEKLAPASHARRVAQICGSVLIDRRGVEGQMVEPLRQHKNFGNAVAQW